MDKLNKLKFPVLLVAALMFFTPLVDRAINSDFTLLTYAVEGTCATAVLGLIVVSAINYARDKK